MEGLGNDFVVLNEKTRVRADLVRRLCDRQRGVGADGVLQVSSDKGVVVMGYWNSDGTQAEMCGNGLRCVTRYAVDFGLATPGNFVVSTPSGMRRVQSGDDPRVELGEAAVGETFTSQGRPFVRVQVGNPHAVTIVEDVARAPVTTIGPALEAATKGGVNVEFINILDLHRLEMRVWERGVGETLACGSGMVAATAAAFEQGLVAPTVSVHVPGGVGQVEITNETTWLTGPARYVFTGEIDL